MNSQFQLKRVNLDKEYLLLMETNELNQVFCNCWDCQTAPTGMARKALIKMIINSGNFQRPQPEPEPEPEPEEEVIQAQPLIQEVVQETLPIKLSTKDYIIMNYDEYQNADDEDLDYRSIRNRWVIKDLDHNDYRKLKRDNKITGRCEVWQCYNENEWVILVHPKTTTATTPNLAPDSPDPQ